MIDSRDSLKNRLSVIVGIFLGLTSFLAAASDFAPNANGTRSQPLTSEQLQEDVRFVFTAIEQIHPNPYYGINREEVLLRKEALLQRLETSLTIPEFHAEIARFVTAYGDDHTEVIAPRGMPRDRPPVNRLYLWKFRVLPDRVGYLEFVSMGNRPKWQDFLKQTFTTVKNEQLAGLIIDLRTNTGGDSQLGDDLLAYLTDKSYRPIASKAWRFSARYVAQMNPVDPWGFALGKIDEAPPIRVQSAPRTAPAESVAHGIARTRSASNQTHPRTPRPALAGNRAARPRRN